MIQRATVIWSLTTDAAARNHRRIPRYPRPRIAGATCFFTVVSYRRRPIFCDTGFREALRNAILRVRADHPFTIDAWVLLPEPLHCIWTLPIDDADYNSLRRNLIKRLTTQACAGHYADDDIQTLSRTRRRAPLWQRRFREHQIRDDDGYRRHMDYLHMNPVRHGYCAQPDA